MALKVTLVSWNKGSGHTAWRALHTCFSHANHTHLHPGKGFCRVQSPGKKTCSPAQTYSRGLGKGCPMTAGL